MSYPEIGREMFRDHTSVIYAVASIEARRNVDAILQGDLYELTKRLENLVPPLDELVVEVRYLSPEMLARKLKAVTLATGGVWNPPQPKYGDHLFVIDLMGITASGFDEAEACHYWRKIALQIVEAQAA